MNSAGHACHSPDHPSALPSWARTSRLLSSILSSAGLEAAALRDWLFLGLAYWRWQFWRRYNGGAVRSLSGAAGASGCRFGGPLSGAVAVVAFGGVTGAALGSIL